MIPEQTNQMSSAALRDRVAIVTGAGQGMAARRLRVAEHRAALQNAGALAVECRFTPARNN